MKYIKDYKEGDRVCDIYLCKHKQSAVTKNGKPYDNVILQDKTGTVDAKIWDPNDAGIEDFDSLDYIEVYGDVTSFQGANQINVKRIRKCREGEYNAEDYLPVSKYPIDDMMRELIEHQKSLPAQTDARIFCRRRRIYKSISPVLRGKDDSSWIRGRPAAAHAGRSKIV